jgi:hypothetical protein
MCVYILSIHSVYLVSDLEGSDIGDPVNRIVYCLSCKSRSSHGLENVISVTLRASE